MPPPVPPLRMGRSGGLGIGRNQGRLAGSVYAGRAPLAEHRSDIQLRPQEYDHSRQSTLKLWNGEPESSKNSPTHLNIQPHECKGQPIPKRLVQTWYKPARELPAFVVKAARAFAPGFVHSYYSDADCIRYLQVNYGDKHAQMFRDLRCGAHKADFFRYCFIYREGGVYMDIDMQPLTTIHRVMERLPPGTIVTCIDVEQTGIFQAFLAAPPKHPLFDELIQEFFSKNVETHKGSPPYSYFTKHMGHVLKRRMGRRVHSGLQRLLDGSYLFLLEERYIGSRPRIENMYVCRRDKILFRSRYKEYDGGGIDAGKSSF